MEGLVEEIIVVAIVNLILEEVAVVAMATIITVMEVEVEVAVGAALIGGTNETLLLIILH